MAGERQRALWRARRIRYYHKHPELCRKRCLELRQKRILMGVCSTCGKKLIMGEKKTCINCSVGKEELAYAASIKRFINKKL